MSSPAKVTLRAAVMAGQFFPKEAAPLERAVDQALAGVEPPQGPRPLAVVSPHAGYRFSGRLTGRALAATSGTPAERVMILSPSHRHAFAGLALPGADGYRMPGFDIAIDAAARDALIAAGCAHVEDAAHNQEHGVETQLPFVHRFHPGARVVPLVIGRATDAEVAGAVDLLTRLPGPPPLFVLSSDLSHFLTLTQAQKHDAETARLIETGRAGQLSPAHACGARALRGFMTSDYGQGLRVRRLGMMNSHRTTRDPNRTVGYGAWSFHEGTSQLLTTQERGALLGAARQSLGSYLAKGRVPEVRTSSFAPALQGHAAAFVTLQKSGRLRGCIGSLVAHRPLIADVVENAIKAGFQDPRFRPLTQDELAKVTLKIAVLSPARPMRFADQADLEAQLTPGRDGLILTDERHRGTFLPMVWDSLDTPRRFVEGLKVKAGLPKTHWSETLKIHRFCAESFSEMA